MKISFNQTTQINKYSSRVQPTIINEPEKTCGYNVELPPANLSLVNFPNVSFKARPDMDFLLSYADRFKCAYTGRPMISKEKAKDIYQKLEKRPNAQSAINLLQQLQGFMHDIESIVFDIMKEASHKNKRDFQSILQELAPESLERLKLKQFDILNSTNRVIDTLSKPIAQQVIAARDEALTKMNDGTFGRKLPLERIKSIKAKGNDLQQVIRIYRKWYSLPASANDLDAFIVSYSKRSHQHIAKRLISSAVASVEHVQPHSRGGGSALSNLILVSAQFNHARNTMPLWEYFMLNPQIDFAKNLQNYMDEVIKEIHNKKSKFHQRAYYPAQIKKVIDAETNHNVQLNLNQLKLTHEQIREMAGLQKLGRVYRMVM